MHKSEHSAACPKCGYFNPEGALECSRCGVIFSRISDALSSQANVYRVESPKPRSLSKIELVGILALSGLVLTFVFSPSKPDDSAVRHISHKNTYHISDIGTFGCKNRETFRKLMEYVECRDQIAFLAGYDQFSLIGECIEFNPGDEVFIVERDQGSELVVLRKRGSLEEYWSMGRVVE